MNNMITPETASGSAFGTALSTIIMTLANKVLTEPFDTTDTGLLIASGGVVIGGLIGWRRGRQ